MILVGLGANLPSPEHGEPAATIKAALAALDGEAVAVKRCSRLYRSAPVPRSDQPWFVNAVAEVTSDLPADRLLDRLHEIEAAFGRVRRERNAPRVIDLDLLAYHDLVSGPGEAVVLPHPRLAERAFVLLPLAELAPDWRHPVSGLRVGELIAALPAGQTAEPLPSLEERGGTPGNVPKG